MEEVS